MASPSEEATATATRSMDEESSTIVVTEDRQEHEPTPAVVLKLRKPKTDKNIQWKEGTVDNENMNKKKSKCCCIYEKPRLFGESSDEDDSDGGCPDHCRGHKKKCFHQPQDSNQPHDTEKKGSEEPKAP